MKPTLIVVTSPQNDKNSKSYHKRIKSYWNDQFKDEINLQEVFVPSQRILNEYLQANKGSVLLLHPTELKLYGDDKTRDIEKLQVVDAVISNIPNNMSCDRILLFGSGKVNEELDNRLRYKGRVIATCAYSDEHLLDDEFISHFDIVVNSTRYDAEVSMFYTENVIDVAGNYKSDERIVIDDKVIVKHIPQPNVISRGVIGEYTTRLMFMDVINNGY